jgi:hypothetical protein
VKITESDANNLEFGNNIHLVAHPSYGNIVYEISLLYLLHLNL